MKKALVISLAIITALAGCGKDIKDKEPEHSITDDSATAPEQCRVFVEITNIKGNEVYVRPEDGSWELRSSDCFSVPVESFEDIISPEVGMALEIIYGGSIQETYPARFDYISSISVTDRELTISKAPDPEEPETADPDLGTAGSQTEIPRRCVMINDTLYLDTGYVSGVWGRCGTADGSIESVIPSDEIPDENGEANFEAKDWQWGFEENTIDVRIGDEYCIFGAEGTMQGESGYIPESVLQFLASVEEVSDTDMIVRPSGEISEKFGQINTDKRYQISLDHYDPGIYVDTPVPGNMVIVICKSRFEGEDPIIITDVYSVSPIGGDFCRPVENP